MLTYDVCDIISDFLLIILRRLLPFRPSLKV